MTIDRALAGAAVVVTGAGGGLGLAYARLAAEHGASVVVNDIDPEAAQAAAEGIIVDGGSAVADHSDISDWAGAETAIGTCIERFGTIDGLVNNAGVISVGKPQDETEESIRRVVGVNLLGSAFCGVIAIRHMVEAGSGAVVNVTSGAHLGLPLVGGYAASKGGISSLTYAWAADLVGTGVRVNAVSPDARTPLADTVASEFPEVVPGTSTPESNAAAVVYLLSARSAPLTGQIVVTGGERMTVLERPTLVRPAARHDDWTVDSVQRAFEERGWYPA